MGSFKVAVLVEFWFITTCILNTKSKGISAAIKSLVG